jgi:hypothetical protein
MTQVANAGMMNRQFNVAQLHIYPVHSPSDSLGIGWQPGRSLARIFPEGFIKRQYWGDVDFLRGYRVRVTRNGSIREVTRKPDGSQA